MYRRHSDVSMMSFRRQTHAELEDYQLKLNIGNPFTYMYTEIKVQKIIILNCGYLLNYGYQKTYYIMGSNFKGRFLS